MMNQPPPPRNILNDQAAENITRGEPLAYEIRIEQVMVNRPLTVKPEMSMRDALDSFRTSRISGAPVVDARGDLVGVISMEDILEEIIGREIVDESDKARNMRELAMIRKKKLHTV